MRCNQAGIDLIKEFEGCRLESYKDINGIWTCGWGATGPDIIQGTSWTQEEADARLLEDLRRFEDGVSALVSSQLGQNQFSALVSFSYNLGLGSLKSSTLLRCINKHHFKDAAQEFLKWDRSNGVVVPGLERRREAERSLFLLDQSFS